MDLSYVEYKDFSLLKTSFEIKFESNSVLFYVWNTLDALKRNTNFEEKEYFGAYVSYPHRKKTGVFGEIHLVVGHINFEIVSHEIQHLVQDYIFEKSVKDDEFIATVAGWITGSFWSKYKGVK